MTRTNSPGRRRFFFFSSSAFTPVLFLVLAATLALLWKLGAGSLAAWDEAIYAQVSKEIVQGGDWLTLHWEYKPWFEKPPLFLWATALLYRFLGVNEFGARAASAFSGIALVAVTYLTGKLSYNERVGLLAATVLLTCYYFLSFSRFGTMEVMLALLIYLALYAYLRLREGDQKWWNMVWVCCALALMVKGAGGLIAPATILLALMFDKRFMASLRSRHFWLGCSLAFMIVAPWHILMYVRYGGTFTDEYVGYHVVARSTRTLEGHPTTFLYYFGKLVDGFFPWCLLVPFGIVSGVKEILKGQPRSRIFLIVSLLVFGLYTLIPTRRPWYIVPVFPALSILVAALVIKLHQSYRERPVYRRLIVSACVLLIVAGGAYSVISLYLNSRSDEHVASLARLARSKSPDERDSLLVFSESEPFYAQIPLFYSDRPVRQAYAQVQPASEDAKRYVNFENLADLVQTSTKRIILRKEDATRLATDYDIDVLAEAGPLVYATIKRKRA
jgi:4-amino-4-deoxy-L-arabinose transferase-like glycosyltransferase